MNLSGAPVQRAQTRQLPSESVPGFVACARATDSKLFCVLLARGSHAGPPATRLSNLADACGFAYALSDQLVPRLGRIGHGPMQFVILLARRGRIRVSARHECQGWSIWLDAECRDTCRWLAGQQQRCQQAIAQRLGQPVRVQLLQRWFS